VNSKWQTTVLAGALALGMTATWASTARAQQDQNGQKAATQDQGAQGGRRGQGRGQGGPGGGPGGFARTPTQSVEQMQTQVKELNLSDEQKTKLEAIFKDANEQAKTLTAEVENLQGRERMQKLMPFQRDLREKVNGVLNDEQKQTLRKNMVTRMAKQMTDRYRRATADLGLSDDQKTKVDAVLADAEKKMVEAAPADGPLGGGVAGGGGGQGGPRGGPFGEIGRDTREKVSALLTDEQKPKFEEAMRARGGQGGGRGARGQGQGQGGAGN
jgi:TolA-binding protein